MRIPSSNTFALIDEFRDSDREDRLFHLDPPEGSPDDWKRITIRVVRIQGPDETESFFFTTLRRSEITRTQLRELYHMRWEAEEFYKVFKSAYIGQGQFRSKSPTGIRQEIHALLLFLAVTRVLMATAAKAVGSDTDSLSQKAAILALAAYVTRIFLPSDESYAVRELRALLHRVAKATYKRRPGRSYPRVSYRPRLRWGSSGRVGG